MQLRKAFLIALLSGTAAFPAQAQQEAPPAPPITDADIDPLDDEEEGTIIVTGQRMRGQVIGDIPPEVTLDEADIRALGASNVAELIQALAPQVASTRGRGGGMPVILINGRRISGFSEVRDLPPEAIERFEILPEEVSLRYGFRADQRVVNIVLRERFQAITGEGELALAGRGGHRADLNYLRIQGAGRLSLNAEYRRDDPLFEYQRDLIQSQPAQPFGIGGNVTATVPGAEIDPALSAIAGRPVTVAGVPVEAAQGAAPLAAFTGEPLFTDLGEFRTLLPANEQISLSGTFNRQLGRVSGTLHGRFNMAESEAQLGLPGAVLRLPAVNPFSPFGNDVLLYRHIDAIGPLRRQTETQARHLGLSLNGDILPWRWSVTANYDRSESETFTDRGVDVAGLQTRIDAGDAALNPFAPIHQGLVSIRPQDQARSINESANAEAVLSGPLVRLPGGPISTTVKVGGETRSFTGRTLRAGIADERALSRDRANVQASIDVPIANRREAFLPALGTLSANFNIAFDHLSDFGTLRTLGYGLNWSPIPELTLIASATDEEGAPSMQQLGDPEIATPNVRVFDFVRNETIDITRIDGGNAGLIADNRRVLRLGVNARPLGEPILSVVANYTRTRIDNPISAFPAITPEIEAAFPERFQRDPAGRLLVVDNRPVNFARSDREEMRWGVNVFMPVGRARAPAGGGGGMAGGGMRPAAAEGAAPAPGGAGMRQGGGFGAFMAGLRRWGIDFGMGGQGRPGGGPPPQGQAEAPPPPPPGGGRGMGRGFGGGRAGAGAMMGMFGGGGTGQGRLQAAVYHTWRFRDEILVREGLPPLDLLDGSAVGSRGGRPRHEIEFQSGYFRNGLGGRLTANWQAGTFVRGAPGGPSGAITDDLFFSDLMTVNLRLFANLGEQQALVAQHPWLRNTRVTLAVDNLFDARMDVRDALGVTPLGYQGAYLDPIGRSVRIGIRKQFF